MHNGEIRQNDRLSGSFTAWVSGARPRTLPAAIVPVAVGTGIAVARSHFRLLEAFLALGVSLALQIGTNYANDYSDGIKGTDDKRSGPVRLVASGLKTPRSVKVASFVFFGVAGVMGLILALLTSLWLIPIGAAAILAGWFYTGGPRPYGYYGYGELFVFIFFGLVAVSGTAFVQVGSLQVSQLVVSVPVGISSVCLLVVNNLRDIPTDTKAGKKTLAVRIGDHGTRTFFGGLILVMFLFVAATSLYFRFAWLGLVAVAFAWPALRPVRRGASGRDLIPALEATGRMQLALALFFSIGIAL